MKLGYLVNTYPRASHSFIRREVQALERQGWHVQRFAMRSDRAVLVDAGDIAEDLRTEHILEAGAGRLLISALGWIITHPLAGFATLREAWALGRGARLRHMIYLAEAAHLARRCRDLRIDHIHAHFGTNSTTVALLCHAFGGPRYSFTVHGPEEFDAPIALSLGRKIERAAFVVAISSFGRSQLCRWVGPAHWDKLQVVHCGIEPQRFAHPQPLPEGGPHLVAIGRFSAQKGFALLIEAMALACPALPGLHLTLVGDGELRDQITGLIAKYGLGPRITLTGWLPEDGVRRVLDGAGALILPSFAEGLPMVVMEAMANARPVIATAIAGVPELVTREVGWTLPAGDATALAEAIQALAALPRDKRIEMGAAARNRVLARHDIDVEAARLGALFKGLAP